MLREKVNGSISVFLAVSLTLVLSFCMVLIESARENTMLLKADIVFDAGLKSVMAEYSVPLWEKYDLLYVDCRYGSDRADFELVKSHLAKYINKNLEYENSGWLSLEHTGTKITDVLLATDFNGKDFYLQAVQAGKASVGISYLEQIKGWFDRVESTYSMGDYLESEMDSLNESIEEANDMEVEVKEAVWGTDINGEPVLLEEAEYEEVDIENPLNQMLSGNILLRQVIEDYDSISAVNISLRELASHRKLAAGTMQDSREESNLWNKLFFSQYAMEHFSYYDGQMQGKGPLQCELEYLIGGKSSDTQNLEVVTAKLLILREIDNYLLLLQDELKKLEAHEIATAVTAALVPWLEPVVYQALLIYWAYEESINDIAALFRGEAIPLVKSLPLELAENALLRYEDYLRILLLMQSRETLAMRSIDIIERSLRKEDAEFQMDACIGQAYVISEFYDSHGKRYEMSGSIQYY